jgi:hypothetical protein
VQSATTTTVLTIHSCFPAARLHARQWLENRCDLQRHTPGQRDLGQPGWCRVGLCPSPAPLRPQVPPSTPGTRGGLHHPLHRPSSPVLPHMLPAVRAGGTWHLDCTLLVSPIFTYADIAGISGLSNTLTGHTHCSLSQSHRLVAAKLQCIGATQYTFACCEVKYCYRLLAPMFCIPRQPELVILQRVRANQAQLRIRRGSPWITLESKSKAWTTLPQLTDTVWPFRTSIRPANTFKGAILTTNL